MCSPPDVSIFSRGSGFFSMTSQIACVPFVQDAAARSLFSTKVDPAKRGDGFNMGDRDSILDSVEAGPILVHVALAEGRQYPYEAIMRSVFKHLMDSATSEYLFTIEFFKVCCDSSVCFPFGIACRRQALELLRDRHLTFSPAPGLVLVVNLCFPCSPCTG